MWLKIAKVVATVAVQVGAVDWAKAWLKKRLQKQLEKAKSVAEEVVATAEAHDIKGVYGITVNRKRVTKAIEALTAPEEGSNA